MNEAQETKQELIDLLDKASMRIHKWCSSHLEVVPDEISNHKLLGTSWNSNEDKYYWTAPETDVPKTKRQLLAYIASIYDNQGLISPYLLEGKLLFQQTWLLSLAWDEELPENIKTSVTSWTTNLKTNLTSLRIPRYPFSTPSNYLKEFYAAFGDASDQAYGACVYLVRVYDQNIESALILSKSRVKPVSYGKNGKDLTIVRMELLAAKLAAQLGSYVKGGSNIPVHYFTDSMVTFHRLKRPPSSFQQWVGNRLQAIASLTTSDIWHYVPTSDNPADLLTRPKSMLCGDQLRLWLEGLSFLTSGCMWPQPPDCKALEDVEELKRHKPQVMTTKTSNDTWDGLLK